MIERSYTEGSTCLICCTQFGNRLKLIKYLSVSPICFGNTVLHMDPIGGENLDALNAADCVLGKTNRAQGRSPEYSSVPALQAMGPTWRLQIPPDLFVAQGDKKKGGRPPHPFFKAAMQGAIVCGNGFPRRGDWSINPTRMHLIDDDVD